MFIGATSNIKPSPALLEAWSTARLDPSVRALQIQVKGEALELVQTLPKQGTAKDDFCSLPLGSVLTPTDSCFLLFALDAGGDAPSWVLVSYIPVGTAVRNKMLYSSSLQGLKQALGPFAGVYSADEEASYEGLLEKASVSSGGGSRMAAQRLKGVQTWGGGGGCGCGEAAASEEDAPLTELEKLKMAERHLEKDSRVRLPGLKAGAPFALHDDARAALEALAAASASGSEPPSPALLNCIELSVHPDEQAVRLAGSKAVPALLKLSGDVGQLESEVASLIAPAQARFYVLGTRHQGSDGPLQLLFLYFCPSEAPVRHKMGCSVQKKTVVEQAEHVLGRPFTAVLEAQELADVALALGGAMTESSAGAEGGAAAGAAVAAVAAVVAVSRPQAPGRRGASTRVKTLLAKDDSDDGDDE